MRGHEALITLRREKKRPQGVWISHNRSSDCLSWHLYADTLPYPEIEILPTENPAALDLRFVVGLTVHVNGCGDYQKGKRLHDALRAAGARRVISVIGDVLIDSERGEFDGYVPE
jgi:hypothetical protein